MQKETTLDIIDEVSNRKKHDTATLTELLADHGFRPIEYSKNGLPFLVNFYRTWLRTSAESEELIFGPYAGFDGESTGTLQYIHTPHPHDVARYANKLCNARHTYPNSPTSLGIYIGFSIGFAGMGALMGAATFGQSQTAQDLFISSTSLLPYTGTTAAAILGASTTGGLLFGITSALNLRGKHLEKKATDEYCATHISDQRGALERALNL